MITHFSKNCFNPSNGTIPISLDLLILMLISYHKDIKIIIWQHLNLLYITRLLFKIVQLSLTVK